MGSDPSRSDAVTVRHCQACGKFWRDRTAEKPIWPNLQADLAAEAHDVRAVFNRYKTRYPMDLEDFLEYCEVAADVKITIRADFL